MPEGSSFIDKIKRRISYFSLQIFVKLISRHNYDLVNVIGQNQHMLSLSVSLHKKGVNIVHSLHEIYKNHLTKICLFPHVSSLIQNKVRINVFSEKSSDDLRRLTSIDNREFTIIPFDLFTGYREYQQVENASSLAEKMKIMNDEATYNIMIKYLNTYVISESDKRWNKIADMYVKLI